MSMVIRDIATIRKEGLIGLLTLFSMERFAMGLTQSSLIITEPEPQYAEELQLAAPYLVKPTHLKTLFIVKFSGNHERSVALAISDNYLTVGAHDTPDQALFAGKNIFVYRLEHVGQAVKAILDYLINDNAPYDHFEAMLGKNGIANLPQTDYMSNGAGIALSPNL